MGKSRGAEEQAAENVLGLLEVDTQQQPGQTVAELELEEEDEWVLEAVGQCICGPPVGTGEMNVSRQRQCYHGNVGVQPPLPSMMAFQQIPPSTSSAPQSVSSAPGASSSLAALGEDAFDQDMSGQWESDGYGVSDVEEQQMMGSMGGEGGSYIGGRFRTFGPTMASHAQSWHQPVTDDGRGMQFYSAHQQQQQQQQSPVFASPAPPLQMPGPSSGPHFGSYANSMAHMMGSGGLMPPYYQSHHQHMGPVGSSYYMEPSASPHRHPRQQHFDSMNELNDRRPFASGSHLSIMASNPSPPDHMLHIYPSNLANR